MPANRLAHRLMVLLIVSALLSLALAAWAGADPLVGKWRYANGSVLEFTVDGIMTIRGPDGALGTKMRYWTEEGSTLVMVQEEDQTMTTGYQLSAGGKRLTLDSMDEAKDKAPDVLERIK